MANNLVCLIFLALFFATCSAQYEKFGLVPLGTVKNEGPPEIFISTASVTWYQAQYYCDAAGLKIVGIPGANKDAQLRQLLFNRGIDAFWTSGNDLETNNKYFWNDNMTPINWTPWHFNPSLIPRDMDKCCLLFQSTTGAPPSVSTRPWDEEFCHNYHLVACEL